MPDYIPEYWPGRDTWDQVDENPFNDYQVRSSGMRGNLQQWLGVRVSKIGKIIKILQIFGGLVLGCIKMNFCKTIRVR